MSLSSGNKFRCYPTESQELADAMRVGEGYETDCGDACSLLPSMIRETPTTTVLTRGG